MKYSRHDFAASAFMLETVSRPAHGGSAIQRHTPQTQTEDRLATVFIIGKGSARSGVACGMFPGG